MTPLSRPTARASAALAVLMMAVMGCSGGGDDLVTVTGSVSFNGQPVETGTIQFTPADGQGSPVGGEIADGSFSIRTTPGPKKVSIYGEKVVARERREFAPPGQEVYEIKENYIPSQFNDATILAFDVPSDGGSKEFALTGTAVSPSGRAQPAAKTKGR